MMGMTRFAAALLIFGLAEACAAHSAGAAPLHDISSGRCSGDRFAITTVSGGTSPYVELSAGRRKGFFLLDYGTTESSLSKNLFSRDVQRASDIVNETFSLPTFALGRFWISDYGSIQAPSGGQAGIVGTDFLSLLTADFSFRGKSGDVIAGAQPCDPKMLRARGMVAVRQRGFFSSDLRSVDHAMPNVPVLFIGIGDVSTFAQIDTGYDDRVFPPSIDINDALYEKLVASGAALKLRGRVSIATCHGIVTNEVFAVQTPVSLQTDEGRDIRPIVGAALIRKRPNGCGGIADMRSPATQLGMSVVSQFQSIVIDPRAGVVWVPRH